MQCSRRWNAPFRPDVVYRMDLPINVSIDMWVTILRNSNKATMYGRLGPDVIHLDSPAYKFAWEIINYQIISKCYSRDILIVASSFRERTRLTDSCQSLVPSHCSLHIYIKPAFRPQTNRSIVQTGLTGKRRWENFPNWKFRAFPRFVPEAPRFCLRGFYRFKVESGQLWTWITNF